MQKYLSSSPDHCHPKSDPVTSSQNPRAQKNYNSLRHQSVPVSRFNLSPFILSRAHRLEHPNVVQPSSTIKLGVYRLNPERLTSSSRLHHDQCGNPCDGNHLARDRSRRIRARPPHNNCRAVVPGIEDGEWDVRLAALARLEGCEGGESCGAVDGWAGWTAAVDEVDY